MVAVSGAASGAVLMNSPCPELREWRNLVKWVVRHLPHRVFEQREGSFEQTAKKRPRHFIRVGFLNNLESPCRLRWSPSVEFLERVARRTLPRKYQEWHDGSRCVELHESRERVFEKGGREGANRRCRCRKRFVEAGLHLHRRRGQAQMHHCGPCVPDASLQEPRCD